MPREVKSTLTNFTSETQAIDYLHLGFSFSGNTNYLERNMGHLSAMVLREWPTNIVT